jgi:hypothetical protein
VRGRLQEEPTLAGTQAQCWPLALIGRKSLLARRLHSELRVPSCTVALPPVATGLASTCWTFAHYCDCRSLVAVLPPRSIGVPLASSASRVLKTVSPTIPRLAGLHLSTVSERVCQ